MRFLFKVNIPVDTGNAAAKAGRLGGTIQSILVDLKPEAVYFTDDKRQRTAFIFLDMQDASQIPAVAEPWFLAFNAQGRDAPGHGPRGSREGRPGDRSGGQEVPVMSPMFPPQQ